MDERVPRDSAPERRRGNDDEAMVEVHLTLQEIALLRTGLEMLQDTFGHEEAEELQEVQALLAKLPSVGNPAL